MREQQYTHATQGLKANTTLPLTSEARDSCLGGSAGLFMQAFGLVQVCGCCCYPTPFGHLYCSRHFYLFYFSSLLFFQRGNIEDLYIISYGE